MNMLDLLNEVGYQPKRKASTHLGEYSSPCPFCKEGTDRFLIWPERNNKNGELQGGRYSCRVCRKYGDAITFLRDCYGLTYKEACEKLRIAPKMHTFPIFRESLKAPLVFDPPALWQEKALGFTEWCHTQLLANPTALQEIKARGFTLESVEKFKFGLCPRAIFRNRQDWALSPQLKGNGKSRKLWLPMGITIPTYSEKRQVMKIKVRRLDWKNNDKLPKYVEISGSKQAPSIFGDISLACPLILESEFDALLVQQFASDLVYCIAFGGSTKPLDGSCEQLLRKMPLILFCPDFDKAGKVAWDKWKNMFPNICRILTPDGKGVGDAYLAGIDLRKWILDKLQT